MLISLCFGLKQKLKMEVTKKLLKENIIMQKIRRRKEGRKRNVENNDRCIFICSFTSRLCLKFCIQMMYLDIMKVGL